MNKQYSMGVWGVLGLAVIWMSMNTHMILTNSEENESYNESTQSMVSDVSSQMMYLQTSTDQAISDMRDETSNMRRELTSFEDAFRSNREMYGAGFTFTWNGETYTTDWKEELTN